MADLSPAAQAVLDAAAQAMECIDGFLPYEQELMAAALRAAAAQVIEEVSPVEAILAIAAELEATNGN